MIGASNASYIALNRSGTLVLCDTNHPDAGLFLTEVVAGALSWMEAPTDSVYGLQRTHPHPAFSHDQRLITFASGRTGHARVCAVEVERQGSRLKAPEA